MAHMVERDGGATCVLASPAAAIGATIHRSTTTSTTLALLQSSVLCSVSLATFLPFHLHSNLTCLPSCLLAFPFPPLSLLQSPQSPSPPIPFPHPPPVVYSCCCCCWCAPSPSPTLALPFLLSRPLSSRWVKATPPTGGLVVPSRARQAGGFVESRSCPNQQGEAQGEAEAQLRGG
jgi:hypothetical protein